MPTKHIDIYISFLYHISMENTKHTLYYIAGFFDGEGSISILKYRKSDKWNYSYFLQVSIGQKDGETLDWVKDHFGGNVYQVKRDGSYYWTITNNKAYLFIKKIVSFLQYKKPQAKLAIKFYEEQILKAKRHKGEQSQATLLKKDIDIREEMLLEMKSLKKTFVKSKYAGSTTKRTDAKAM